MSIKGKNGVNGYFSEFIEEATEGLDAIFTTLEELETRLDTQYDSQDMVNNLFRLLHSLKGLASMVGITPVSELSHQLETLLDELRMGRLELTKSFLDILHDGVDHLQESLESIRVGKTNYDMTDILAQIKEYIQKNMLAKKPFSLEKYNIDPELLSVLTEYEEHRLSVNLERGNKLLIMDFHFDMESFDTDLAKVNDILAKSGEVISTLPSTEDVPSEKINFKLVYITNSFSPELEKELEQFDYSIFKAESKQGIEPKEAITVEDSSREGGKGKLVPGQEPGNGKDSTDFGEEVVKLQDMATPVLKKTLRVDLTRIDNAMNLVGELHIIQLGIQELSSQLPKVSGYKNIISSLQKKVWEFEKRLEELRNSILEIRMVPLRGLLKNLERYVKKLERETGKKVSFHVTGEDTEMDKSMIESIHDPLIHIIRNAFHHGIEVPEKRIKQGKPARGTINVHIIPQNKNIVIEVRDDGRGLQEDKIRKKAIQMGLIKKDENVSHEKLVTFIFHPGFSTTDEVDQVSGRGVGMDVVQKTIHDLKGVLEIHTEQGKGTSISMILPITLALIPVLMVSVDSTNYAIPLTGILATGKINQSSIQTLDNQPVIQYDDSPLPLYFLKDILGSTNGEIVPTNQYFIVFQTAERRIGVVVDKLLGEREIVIKPIGERLGEVPGVSGVAETGDKDLVLVLDIGMLVAGFNNKVILT